MYSPSATIHLRVLGRELSATVQLPDQDVSPQSLLPVAYTITDALVHSAAEASAAAGRPVSCRKGCSACCRQLVLLAPVEAHALAQLVAQLPDVPQARIRAKFASAIHRLRSAGMVPPDAPDHAPVLAAPRTPTRALAVEAWLDAYFDLRIDCPFLEDDACSIYAHRPTLCRQYVVTTPAENCAAVGKLPTVTVELPLYMSEKLLSFGITPASTPPAPGQPAKIPLPFALAWFQAHAAELLPPAKPAALLTQLIQLLDTHALTPFADRHARESAPALIPLAPPDHRQFIPPASA